MTDNIWILLKAYNTYVRPKIEYKYCGMVSISKEGYQLVGVCPKTFYQKYLCML